MVGFSKIRVLPVCLGILVCGRTFVYSFKFVWQRAKSDIWGPFALFLMSKFPVPCIIQHRTVVRHVLVLGVDSKSVSRGTCSGIWTVRLPVCASRLYCTYKILKKFKLCRRSMPAWMQMGGKWIVCMLYVWETHYISHIAQYISHITYHTLHIDRSITRGKSTAPRLSLKSHL